MGLAKHWPELVMMVEIGIMLDLDGICEGALDQAHRCVGMTYNVTRLAQPSCLKRGAIGASLRTVNRKPPVTVDSATSSDAQISHYKATAAV